MHNVDTNTRDQEVQMERIEEEDYDSNSITIDSNDLVSPTPIAQHHRRTPNFKRCHIWDHYYPGDQTPKGNHRAATCKYCGQNYRRGKPDLLINHLKNRCQHADREVKLLISSYDTSTPRRRPSGSQGEVVATEQQLKNGKKKCTKLVPFTGGSTGDRKDNSFINSSAKEEEYWKLKYNNEKEFHELRMKILKNELSLLDEKRNSIEMALAKKLEVAEKEKEFYVMRLKMIEAGEKLDE